MVWILAASIGFNVLLGFRVVKLSNKVNGAEIDADYWRKQYEANRNADLESTQKSHDVLEEAFEELNNEYTTVRKDLIDAEEDYATLSEQYSFVCNGYDDAFLDSTLSHVFLNHHRLLVDFELFKVNYIRADNGLENITMEQFRDDYRCSANVALRHMGISLIRDID